MEKRNNISTKVRDSYITRRAYTLLLAMEIVSLPIDPFEIIKSFGWRLHTVTDAEEYGVKCPFNLNEDKPAINFKIPATGEYVIIYYNEKYLPRLRWSLAHEIGHIILGHKNEFTYKLTKEEYDIAEIEAHLFAEELLAPTKILNSNFFPKNANDIARLCNISDDAADKKINKFTGARLFTANSIMYPEAEKLHQNLYNYLLSISDYWNGRLTEASITLPIQYEDYCCCEYWAYVKSKMTREHKTLFTLIDDSIAFYDNTDLVLFVRNQNAVNIDNTQKRVILDYLSKYANSSIRNIVSILTVA